MSMDAEPLVGRYKRRAAWDVWCDFHGSIHPRVPDVYEEGAYECAPINWRAVFVATNDPNEIFD